MYDHFNLLNKEKSQINNLCFFLFHKAVLFAGTAESIKNEEDLGDSYDTLDHPLLTSQKDEDGFHIRLNNLSKTNLIILVNLYCKSHNELHKLNFQNQKTENRKMNYIKKQIFSKDEKIFFIQSLKNDGWNKDQIAKELYCRLRTVERYWN